MDRRKTSKAIIPAMMLLVLALAACAETPEQAQAKNEQALAHYVDIERVAGLSILTQSGSPYKDLQIEGGFKSNSAGYSAVMSYSYTYAGAIDFELQKATLESRSSALDSACRLSVFPAMRQAGVTGPLAAEYTYYAELKIVHRSPSDPSWAGPTMPTFGDSVWTHTCMAPD
jgi:hypothetical protein